MAAERIDIPFGKRVGRILSAYLRWRAGGRHARCAEEELTLPVRSVHAAG
jgi:hypothetical protein